MNKIKEKIKAEEALNNLNWDAPIEPYQRLPEPPSNDIRFTMFGMPMESPKPLSSREEKLLEALEELVGLYDVIAGKVTPYREDIDRAKKVIREVKTGI